jgi:tRNA (Thr-GGU) A37 N-methylase
MPDGASGSWPCRWAVIGTFRGCFTKKNGTPRQPQLAPTSRGHIEVRTYRRRALPSIRRAMWPPRQSWQAPGTALSHMSFRALRLQLTCFDNPEHSVEGLAAYSHVWLLFWFHQNGNKSIRPKVPTLSAHRPIVRSSRGCLAARHCTHACVGGATGTERTAAGAAASARRCEDRRVRDALAPPAEPGRAHTRALGERRRLGRPRIRCVALPCVCLASLWRVLLRVLCACFARAERCTWVPPTATCVVPHASYRHMPPTATCLAPPYFSGERKPVDAPGRWMAHVAHSVRTHARHTEIAEH